MSMALNGKFTKINGFKVKNKKAGFDGKWVSVLTSSGNGLFNFVPNDDFSSEWSFDYWSTNISNGISYILGMNKLNETYSLNNGDQKQQVYGSTTSITTISDVYYSHYVYGPYTSSISPYTFDGSTIHVCIQKTGSTIKYIINGKEISTVTSSAISTTPTIGLTSARNFLLTASPSYMYAYPRVITGNPDYYDLVTDNGDGSIGPKDFVEQTGTAEGIIGFKFNDNIDPLFDTTDNYILPSELSYTSTSSVPVKATKWV